MKHAYKIIGVKELRDIEPTEMFIFNDDIYAKAPGYHFYASKVFADKDSKLVEMRDICYPVIELITEPEENNEKVENNTNLEKVELLLTEILVELKKLNCK